MKYRLMDLLACPICKHFPLELIVIEEKVYPDRKTPSNKPLCELYCGYKNKYLKEMVEEPPCNDCIKKEIVTGVLYCNKCGRWYPIINTIPHMLPDYIRKKEKEREIRFLREYKEYIPRKILYKGQPYNLSTS